MADLHSKTQAPSVTHCSQFSLLSCRSARKRLDARASSPRSSSCRCSSRMAERIRRRSARSAVTSSCNVGGSEGWAFCQGQRTGTNCPQFCQGHNGWLVSSLSTLSLPRACLPLRIFRGDLAHDTKDPEKPTVQCGVETTFCECTACSHRPKPGAKQPGTPLWDLTSALLGLSLTL